MRRRKLLYGIGASSAVLLPSGLTAAAYNSFSIDRDATIGVKADDQGNGILTLDPGSSGVVSTNGGELTINVGKVFGGDVGGQNVDSTLSVGNDNPGDNYSVATDDPYAFKVEDNAGSGSYDVDFDLSTPNNDPNDSTNNVRFKFFNDDGSTSYTVSEDTTATLDFTTDNPMYAVLKIETEGTSSGDDLTGTLTFSTQN
jgi:hypothetical protein